MKNIIYRTLKKSEINNVLKLSPLAFDKFSIGCEKIAIWNFKYENYKSFQKLTPNRNKEKVFFSLPILYFNLMFLVVKTIVGSFTYSIILSVVQLLSKEKFYKTQKVKFILFRSQPKLTGYLKNLTLNIDEYKIISIPNFNTFSRSKLKKINLNWLYLLPKPNLLVHYLRYSFKSYYLNKTLINHNIDKEAILKVNDMIIKMIYYQHINDVFTKKISSTHPYANIIVENDFGGQLMSIVDRFNKLGVKTIHVQHGVFTRGNFEYIPQLAKYMLCCSDREKNLQTEFNSSNKNNYFTFGAPFQTYKDLYFVPQGHQSGNYVNDIIILGRNGPVWKQEMDINLLKKALYSTTGMRVKLRPHPRNTKKQYLKWSNITLFDSVSNNNSLIEDIQKSEIIITFSLDALVTALINKKKIVLCANYEGKAAFDFLESLSNVLVIDDADGLEKALTYFITNDSIEIDSNYNEFLEYSFGIYKDAETGIEKFHHAINEIYCR